MQKKNDMKRAIRIGVYCLVLGVLLSGKSFGQASQPAIALEDLPPEVLAYPELILFNGRILTVDEQFSTQEALAVRDERILALGNSSRILKMAGPKTRKLDLKGQTVLPGFIDSHLHLGDYAMDYMLLEEKEIRWEGRIERLGIVWEDQEVALRDIRRAVDAAAPGEWIRIPTREGNRIFQTMTLEQLDTLAPENPLVLTDVSQGGRPAVVNTQAIQVAEIPPSSLPKENAVISDNTAALLAEYFTWAFPMEKVIPWHKKAMKLVNSWGLTTVVTRIRPEQFTALRAIWLQNELTVRWRVGFPGPLYIARTGNLSDIGDDWLRISGADGGLAVPGSDAVLDHWSSRVPPSPDELSTWSARRRQFLDALRYGWSIPNTHIKGNIAVREVLDVIEEARKNPVVRSPNQRLTMDHMQEIDDRDILRIKELGVIPSSQMIDLFCDEHPEGSSRYQSVFGADHVNAMLPIKKYLELGIHPAVEADSGDEKHGNPLWGIEKLVCRCVDGSPVLVRNLSLILLATLSFSIEQPPAEEAESNTLTGHFLVATTQLQDPGFAKTVVYILKHSADGAMGIIVNRPRGKVSFAEISETMGLELSEDQTELVVFYGGPVELDRGLLLHSSDVLLETSHVVRQGVAVTSDPALLKSIAQGTGPENYIFALGYAGWAPNQLETEIAAGSWLTQEADLPSLFAEEPEKTWELLIGKRVFRL